MKVEAKLQEEAEIDNRLVVVGGLVWQYRECLKGAKALLMLSW